MSDQYDGPAMAQHIYRLREQIEKLKAERDAAVADAERYRWLRDKDTGPAAIWETIDSVNGQLTLKCEGELDAAIDAARGKP